MIASPLIQIAFDECGFAYWQTMGMPELVDQFSSFKCPDQAAVNPDHRTGYIGAHFLARKANTPRILADCRTVQWELRRCFPIVDLKIHRAAFLSYGR